MEISNRKPCRLMICGTGQPMRAKARGEMLSPFVCTRLNRTDNGVKAEYSSLGIYKRKREKEQIALK